MIYDAHGEVWRRWQHRKNYLAGGWEDMKIGREKRAEQDVNREGGTRKEHLEDEDRNTEHLKDANYIRLKGLEQ